MLKRLFYISATLFLLVATYTLAAHRAQAQAGAQVIGFTTAGNGGTYIVMTSTGDCFLRPVGDGRFVPQPAQYVGNFWSGGTVAVQSESWTGVKEKYRK